LKFSRFEPYKVLAYYDKLKELSRGNICDPVQFIVYPSNVCNLNCGHCIMTEERHGKEMLSKETLDKLVVDCSRLGVRTVIFSGGGEPLANPHTIPTMQKLRDIGVRVGLNTNGLLLKPNIPVDYLRVSVDASNEAGYAKVKGHDGWNRLNDNLCSLGEVGELGLAFLVRHDNHLNVEQFCQWAQQFPYTFLHVRPAYWPEHDEKIKDACHSLLRDKERLETRYPRLNIIASKFDGFWNERLYPKCRATSLKAVLCADGRFAVCQDNFIKFGDYNRQTFDEAWYGDKHRAAIESINLNQCPRCVETNTNEIIEHCIKGDSLRMGLI
jgi:uncharacterized protein